MRSHKIWLVSTVLFLAPLLRIVQFSLMSRSGMTYSVYVADYIIILIGVVAGIYLTFKFNVGMSKSLIARVALVFVWIFLFGIFTLATSFSFQLLRVLIIENYMLVFAFLFSIFFNYISYIKTKDR